MKWIKRMKEQDTWNKQTPIVNQMSDDPKMTKQPESHRTPPQKFYDAIDKLPDPEVLGAGAAPSAEPIRYCDVCGKPCHHEGRKCTCRERIIPSERDYGNSQDRIKELERQLGEAREAFNTALGHAASRIGAWYREGIISQAHYDLFMDEAEAALREKSS